MRLRTFSIRTILVPLAAGVLFLAACGGDDTEATATPGPVGAGTPAPTATPFASVPEPVVVTSDGSPSNGGSASETAASYVVEDGDTLGGIAERFGVEVEVIQEANDLDGVDIFIGQELVIPRQGPSGTDGGADGGTGGSEEPAATATPSAPSGVDTYTVEAGDTAFGIALEFDTSVEELEAANGVGEGGLDDLQIGQVIRLPRP